MLPPIRTRRFASIGPKAFLLPFFLWLFFSLCPNSLFLLGPKSGHAASTEVIPQTNWTLQFVDSEELVGYNGAAINSFDGDAGTFWHTESTNADPPHPHEIQINLGAVYDIGGFRYLPRQDMANGRVAQYEFYVTLQ